MSLRQLSIVMAVLASAIAMLGELVKLRQDCPHSDLATCVKYAFGVIPAQPARAFPQQQKPGTGLLGNSPSAAPAMPSVQQSPPPTAPKQAPKKGLLDPTSLPDVSRHPLPERNIIDTLHRLPGRHYTGGLARPL